MKLLRLFSLSIVMLLIFSACNVPQVAQVPMAAASGPKAWIDAPLEGNKLPLEPYEVVYHGSDFVGVSLIEFSINGEVLKNESNSNAAALLITNKYNWEPQQAGNYTLRARTQNTSGGWSEYAVVNVTIIGDATETPTATATMTMTPTGSATPTITPTGLTTQQLVDGSRSADGFYHGSCTPNEITFSVRATNPGEVQYMFLFYKQQDIASGDYTASNDGTNMTKTGADTWSITLNYKNVKDYNKFESSWFIYQFVSQGPDKTITRSVQYNDVQFVKCGGAGIIHMDTIPTLNGGLGVMKTVYPTGVTVPWN